MKQLDTGNERYIMDARPLFSSVWLALYSELRKTYTERQPDENAVKQKLKTFPKNKAG